jgi:hypothetical protein
MDTDLSPAQRNDDKVWLSVFQISDILVGFIALRAVLEQWEAACFLSSCLGATRPGDLDLGAKVW